MTLYPENGLVFDAGPIIGMTLSGTLWVLEALKKEYKGNFIITPAVKKEIVDQPLSTKKYKFESVRVLPYIANNTLKLIDNEEITKKTKEIQDLANSCFSSQGKDITILHAGETECIAACIVLGAKTLVLDERTTRYLIEAPHKIKRRLEKKLHKKVHTDDSKLNILKKMTREIQPIRSTELLTIAFEKNLLTFYEYSNVFKEPNFKKIILEGVLWALKSNGCAIFDTEIDEILKLEKFKVNEYKKK